MARRRGGRGGSVRRGFGNWIVGGSILDGTGAPITPAQTSWGASLTSLTGAARSFVLVSSPDYSPASVNPGQTLVGELEVDAVEGSISFTQIGGAQFAGVVVAIYLARQLSTASTSLAVVDPANPADAMHDDYCFIKGIGIQSAVAAASPIIIPVGISRPVVVPSGHCLICTIGVSGASGTVLSVPFIRSHVRRAA